MLYSNLTFIADFAQAEPCPIESYIQLGCETPPFRHVLTGFWKLYQSDLLQESSAGVVM